MRISGHFATPGNVRNVEEKNVRVRSSWKNSVRK